MKATEVYHRRIGCIRVYIAVTGDGIWRYTTGGRWTPVTGCCQRQTEDIVVFQDKRYARLPDHERFLPPVPVN